MKMFKIYAGLGGSFGGAQYIETVALETKSAADNYAFESACEIYDTYDGMYGLDSLEDLMMMGISEEDAHEMWNEQRENWLDYYAEEISEEELESYRVEGQLQREEDINERNAEVRSEL